MKVRICIYLVGLFAVLFSTKALAYEETYLPEEVVSAIDKYADEYEMDKYLLYAVCEAESSGRQYAENGNCKGLMQVNQYVWKDLMEELEVDDIFDIDGNIHLGVHILNYYIQEQEGDISKGLMRYNGSRIKEPFKESYYAKSINDRARLLKTEGVKKSMSFDIKREEAAEYLGFASEEDALNWLNQVINSIKCVRELTSSKEDINVTQFHDFVLHSEKNYSAAFGLILGIEPFFRHFDESDPNISKNFDTCEIKYRGINVVTFLRG